MSPRGRNLDPPDFIDGVPMARDLPSAGMDEIVVGLVGGLLEQPRRSMTREKYREEYLSSPEWKSIRSLAIERAGRRCADCGLHSEDGKHLDAHHVTYERLGHELLSDLVVVCRLCHDKRHREMSA